MTDKETIKLALGLILVMFLATVFFLHLTLGSNPCDSQKQIPLDSVSKECLAEWAK